MKILVNSFKKEGNIHHAYLIEGPLIGNREGLFDFLSNTFKHAIQANPDFWHGTFDQFSIDDARALKEAQAQKALSGDRKVFVIETQGMTIEAQNSLLKIFEEPTQGTHIFILIPSSYSIIPTLKSRLQLIADQSDYQKMASVKAFIGASIGDRLKMVGEMVEAKDKAGAIELVEGLLHEFHKKGTPEILKNLLKVRSYMNDRSPSLKLLLEHTAVILPVH